MEDYRKAYEEWLNDPYFDEGTRAELKAIENDDKEIRERPRLTAPASAQTPPAFPPAH